MSEIFEFISGTIGLKKFGISKYTVYGTILGAFIGSIIGTLIIPIPIFGTLVGITIGTFCIIFTFETYLNKSINLKKYFYVALISTTTKLVGILSKIVLTILIFFLFVITCSIWNESSF